VGLFTGEPASKTRYPEALTRRLGRAYYYVGARPLFAISPEFVRESMRGGFDKALIIMMGCDGLNYTSMAEAFVQRGAKVYISWSRLVTVSHIDDATIRLLQNLLQQNQTIKTAVELINPDPTYKGELDYYPKGVGNKLLQEFIRGLTL